MTSVTTKDLSNSVYSRLMESVKKSNNKKLLKRIKHHFEQVMGPLSDSKENKFSSFSSLQKDDSSKAGGSIILPSRKIMEASRNSHMGHFDTHSTLRSGTGDKGLFGMHTVRNDNSKIRY